MTTQRDINARLDRAAAGARAADQVIAKIDARQNRYECIICGVDRLHCKHGKCWTCEGCSQCDTYNNDEAPTVAERAVDKVLAAHRLKEAVMDLDRAVARALGADRIIERLYVPCPQGADCLSGQKHERIFACEFCENFKGCSDCVAAHEAEAHWSDSRTTAERIGG